MWEGSRCPCGFTSVGSSYYKMWTGLNGFDPRKDLVLGYVRIAMPGLHESSYCYFKVYTGTITLSHLHQLSWSCHIMLGTTV